MFVLEDWRESRLLAIVTCCSILFGLFMAISDQRPLDDRGKSVFLPFGLGLGLIEPCLGLIGLRRGVVDRPDSFENLGRWLGIRMKEYKVRVHACIPMLIPRLGSLRPILHGNDRSVWLATRLFLKERSLGVGAFGLLRR